MSRIGYPVDFAPFAHRQGGRAAGSLVALLRQRAKARRIDLQFVPSGIDGLPGLLASGGIDAILPKVPTATRSAAFAFSVPLAATHAALFGRGGAPHPAEAGACGIATPFQGPLFDILPRLAPQARLIATADYAGALAAVHDGLADFAALNAEVGALHCRGRLAIGPRFAQFDLCLAAAAGDPTGILSRLGLARD
ncbi:MAG: substrate-binding periplasmic protein [Gemmobacter sp.]